MVDFIIKLVAITLFVGSIVIVAIKIPAPELVAVIVITGAMAIYDIIIRPMRERQ